MNKQHIANFAKKTSIIGEAFLIDVSICIRM